MSRRGEPAISPTRSPRCSSARARCSITTRCSRRASRRSTSPACTCTPRAARTSRRTRSRSAASWCATTHRHARRRRRRVHAQRPVSRRRRSAGRQPHDHRPRAAALPEPRDLQGHPRRPARAVFNGKIIVRQDAQKTDAKQTNRALLLSDDALINTKPQLEIFADDVKCTHGAAIGQLDEDALFYLRARGLTLFEARDMLIHAFAGEILDRVKIEPLKQALESRALRPAGAGSRGGGRSMSNTAVGAPVPDAASRVRRRAHPRRLPDPAPPGPRQAAGLSRQRRHDPEAAGGARRADRLLHRPATPTCTAACTS